jgi:hypothetical protein
MTQSNSSPSQFSVVLPTLGALLFLAALVAMLTGLALLFPSPMWMPMWNLNPEAYEAFHRLGRIAELLLFCLACLSVVTGAGLIKRRRWAWWLALLGLACNGAGDLVSMLLTHNLVRFGSGVLIAAGLVFLLALPPVRRSLS